MSEENSKATTEFWVGVRGQIEAQSATIPATVTNHYVDLEIDERVKLTIAALDELKGIATGIKKIQPDQVAYDAEGKVTNQSFSKSKVEERKKLVERQEKLEKSLEAVFSRFPNFELLKNAKPGQRND